MSQRSASTTTRGMRAPVLFAALTAVAVVLSWLAREHNRLPGDLWITRRVQDLPGAVEGPSDAIRAVTSTETALVLGVALVVAALLAGRRALALQAALTLALLPFVQATVKDIVDRPRPDRGLIAVRDSFTSTSFPSGHVMSGTVLFALVALASRALVRHDRWGRGIAAVCVVLAALNGVANVYVGVHWPSDVAGGYLWAGVVLVGVWAAVRAVRARVKLRLGNARA